jgi:chemotaxis protein histidine kinase CheA
MNGSVNLTSEVGKGSKFRVELPLELAVPVKSEL